MSEPKDPVDPPPKKRFFRTLMQYGPDPLRPRKYVTLMKRDVNVVAPEKKWRTHLLFALILLFVAATSLGIGYLISR